MADYAYREDDSAESAAQMRHGWLRDYAALPAGSEQPLSTFRGRHRAASAAIGYGKAAMMFHALRARLGEDAFRDGVRKFWETYKFKTANFDNLRQVFEETGEQPLVEFFDQWLDRTGAPMLDITSARTIEEDAGLEVHISQDAEPYSLSIPLKVFSRAQEQDFRIELSQPDQSFRLATREAATAVQVDPGFEVWRKLVPGEAPPILRDLIAAEQILVATVDRKPDETVLAFAQEFGEGIAKEIDAGSELDGDAPVLVVSSKAGSADFLERLSLSPRSEELPAGQVEVWIVPDYSRKIVMVALDPEAVANQDLPKLGRRLRHFGRYAWVSFSKDGTAERGSWVVNTPRVTIPK